MDRVAESAPPRLRRARPSVVSTGEKVVRNGASAAAVPARWEWGVAIVVLFVLGRWPVLFFRARLVAVLGPTRWPDWQYDTYVRTAFAAVELVGAALAIRYVRAKSLVRQPFLMAVLGLAWASTIWSVEPGVTIWRALTLIGAATVGAYVGERFNVEQIAKLVSSVATLGAAASLFAVLVAPRLAVSSSNAWSGVYYNRNELALLMSAGILASGLLLTRLHGPARGWQGVAMALQVLMLAKTGSRTGPMALAGCVLACGLVYVVRRVWKGKLTASTASLFSLGVLMFGFSFVEWQWKRIVLSVGRNTSLSHRGAIWYVDRALIAKHPWTGWGFEAIWSNRITTAEATNLMGKFPYSSHSGYYEIAAGLGWIGLGVFALFVTVALYRAFICAWRGNDILSLWPLGIVLFILAANFTESLFVSSEAFFAILVAMSFALTRSTTIRMGRYDL